uniref:Uncharacterized protein n=1 Tax=Setaria italica TaxID=4555 RepID=K3YNN6_SETIT
MQLLSVPEGAGMGMIYEQVKLTRQLITWLLCIERSLTCLAQKHVR